MHGGDGEPHQDRARDFGRAEFTICVAKTKSEKQGDDRDNYGDKNRCGDNAEIIVTLRGQTHGGHADVVHGGNSRSHRQARREYGPGTKRGSTDEKKCNGSREHRGKEREQDGGKVVENAHGQSQSEHADVMHGPDAEAHGEGAGAGPDEAQATLGRGSAAGEIERGVSSEDGDRDGKCDERWGVSMGENRAVDSGGVAHCKWPRAKRTRMNRSDERTDAEVRRRSGSEHVDAGAPCEHRDAQCDEFRHAK